MGQQASPARKPGWYVLTSPPSSGMTTLAEALRPYVDLVIPEAARVLIDAMRKDGIDPKEYRREHEPEFQKRALDMKLETEKRIPRDRLCVFERGVPDTIPYFERAGLPTVDVGQYTVPATPPTVDVWQLSYNRGYTAVFFLEPLTFVSDYARTESEEQRRKLTSRLQEVYMILGYRVITVPAFSKEKEESIAKRVEFVLSHIT